MESRKNENPYPKTVHPYSAKPSHVAPDLNLEAMRKKAHDNNSDHSNLPNGELNAIDRKVGPLKGGC